MKQKLLCFFMLGMLLIGSAYAQDRRISGKVTSSEDGVGIVGVSVQAVGANAGTQTDDQGNYVLTVPGTATSLRFVYLGYTSETVNIGSSDIINVVLIPDEQALEEVVVTALGITRDRKSLGYATQEVSGETLTAARGANPLQSLSGNVAGAMISSPSSSLGGSTRIILRGAGSLTGENRPLIVIDGIPMDNSNYNSVNTERGGGGRDYGDAAFDFNPDDIESINVLKGGPASALYGARASNGVILIKTKSAKQGRDEIVVNTGVGFERLGVVPKGQKLYGGGFSEEFEQVEINGQTYNVADYAADESWGPKLDGTPVLHWDAFDSDDQANYLQPRPWIYPKNDYTSFFNTGVSYNNSIAFAKSFENTSARVSLSNVSQEGIVPNTELKRTTANLNIQNKFSDKFSVNGSLTYVRTDGFNRPEIGYGDNSIGQKMFQWGQVQLDYERMKNYKNPITGEQKPWNRSAWNDARPYYSDTYYWIVNENTASDRRDRFYGNVELRYDFIPGLYAVTNVYGDHYNLNINSQVAVGSQGVSSYQEQLRQFTEMNYEGRLHFDKAWDMFSLNAFAGINRRNAQRYLSTAATSGGLIVRDLYTINNSMQQVTASTTLSHKRVNSVFGSVSAGYNDLLYLDVGLRNDWSSTLPEDNNSYFYPSVTGSFIFSQVISQDWLSFGKLRAGWSQVGNDTDPYRLLDVYANNVFANTTFIDVPYFLAGLSKLNPDLRPETKRSYEFGLEAQFFQSRLGVDFTYYNEETTDLIMAVSTGPETGYSSKLLNAGKTRNRGVEVMLTGVPVQNDDFEWRMNINFARNRNTVLDLYEGIQTLNLTNAPFKAQLIAAKGEPYGQIYGSDFIYDDQGNKVVGANGLYVSSDVKNLGSILPDYNAGIRNTFNYKNFSLSALIDMQKGGKFFSISNMFGKYTGVLEETAANNVRETGVVSEGVTGTVARNADGSYTVTNTEENTRVVPAANYFGHYYSGPTSQNVFDADYFKLREVTLSYTLPRQWTGPFGGITISGFARNLATWGLANSHFDPEMATNGSGNIQGFEGGNLPSSRTFGLNLRLQF